MAGPRRQLPRTHLRDVVAPLPPIELPRRRPAPSRWNRLPCRQAREAPQLCACDARPRSARPSFEPATPTPHHPLPSGPIQRRQAARDPRPRRPSAPAGAPATPSLSRFSARTARGSAADPERVRPALGAPGPGPRRGNSDVRSTGWTDEADRATPAGGVGHPRDRRHPLAGPPRRSRDWGARPPHCSAVTAPAPGPDAAWKRPARPHESRSGAPLSSKWWVT